MTQDLFLTSKTDKLDHIIILNSLIAKYVCTPGRIALPHSLSSTPLSSRSMSVRIEVPRWRAGWVLSVSYPDRIETGMPMTSSHGSPFPYIKEAKLLVKRLLNKFRLKTNCRVHLAFPPSGFSSCRLLLYSSWGQHTLFLFGLHSVCPKIQLLAIFKNQDF